MEGSHTPHASQYNAEEWERQGSVFEANNHRGFRINVEMKDGYFVPAYQDPLFATKESNPWHLREELASTSPKVAEKRCRNFLNHKIKEEMNVFEKEILASLGVRLQP